MAIPSSACLLAHAPRLSIHDMWTIEKRLLGSPGVEVLLYKQEEQDGCDSRMVMKKIDGWGSGSKMAAAEKLVFKALQKSPHPNCLCAGQYLEGESFGCTLVLPYISGGELLPYILETSNGLSEEWCGYLFTEILRGVEHLHNLNILHRDLKPENVLIEFAKKISVSEFHLPKFSDLKKADRPKVVITDYGTCLDTSTNISKVRDPCGTKPYLAPEIYKREQLHGKASDIWSLGILLYGMATAALPVNIDDAIKPDFGVDPRRFHKMPSDLVALLKEMLQVDPTKRIQIAQIWESSWVQKILK